MKIEFKQHHAIIIIIIIYVNFSSLFISTNVLAIQQYVTLFRAWHAQQWASIFQKCIKMFLRATCNQSDYKLEFSGNICVMICKSEDHQL